MKITMRTLHDGTNRLTTDHGLFVETECPPKDFWYIGRRLGVLWGSPSDMELVGQLHDAIRQIDWVIETSEQYIAKARGQIEYYGESNELSDLDVAILDVYMRERLAEAAREIDDPFAPHEGGPWGNRSYVRVQLPDVQGILEDYNK